MALSIGIVGLPNVGKSTLFQSLTKKQVNIANYPFCTIDPNVGVVAVPDQRLDKLAELTKSAQKIPAVVEFVDIAGLVKGASKGEGLGNKFLAHIRETDAILYVLRAFLREDVANLQGRVDPLAEKETLDGELMLKDLETAGKRIDDLEKEAKAGKKETLKELECLKKVKEILEQGIIISEQSFNSEELKIISQYQLLTAKPRLCLLNGPAGEIIHKAAEEFQKNSWPFLTVDLSLDPGPELEALIKKAYQTLGLITFFTTLSNETRAWTVKKGQKVPRAGGQIHSDFENKFIKAQVISWKDLLEAGSFSRAREKGLIRTEGKDYVVEDGDVVEIKHN